MERAVPASAVPGGMFGFGAVMMGVSWILFGLWIVYQHRASVVALAGAAIPALATAICLYGDDRAEMARLPFTTEPLGCLIESRITP